MDKFAQTANGASPKQAPAIGLACETMSSLGSLEARLESLAEKLFGGRPREAANNAEVGPPSGDIRLLRVFAEQHGQRVRRMDSLIDDLFNGLS